MTVESKLADAILAMVQLTPGERQTVMSVVERMRFAKEQEEHSVYRNTTPPPRWETWETAEAYRIARLWDDLTKADRDATLEDLAKRNGRGVHACLTRVSKIRHPNKSKTK
jgi:hypothetical protein